MLIGFINVREEFRHYFGRFQACSKSHQFFFPFFKTERNCLKSLITQQSLLPTETECFLYLLAFKSLASRTLVRIIVHASNTAKRHFHIISAITIFFYGWPSVCIKITWTFECSMRSSKHR